MKVILNQSVPKLGKQGQVVTVADGYARNYLFPKKLATFAERSQLKALEKRKIKIDARLAETKADAEALKAKIDGLVVKIEGKVGKDSTKLFGAVTAQDVADAIKTQLNIEVEKKQVGIIAPLKRLGKHEIEIDLHRDVDAKVIVNVFDPNAPVEEQAPAAEAPVAEAGEPETVTA